MQPRSTSPLALACALGVLSLGGVGCTRLVSVGGDPGASPVDAGGDRPALVDVSGTADSDTAASRAWSFSDDDHGDFDKGSYGGSTQYASARLQLAGPPFGASGEYRSRIFDTASAATRWAALSWTPAAPSLKPLPDGGRAEQGYSSGGIDMTGNVLLYHLDATGGDSLQGGGRITDTSGRDHHGVVVNANDQGSSFARGVLAGAAQLAKADYIRVTDTSTSADFDFGKGDFTWAVWVKPEPCAGHNRIYLGGQRGADPRVDPHVWLGGACGSTCAGPDAAAAVVIDSDSKAQYICGPTLDTTGWHHLVLRKMGHGSHNVALFVDGMKYDHASGHSLPTKSDTFSGSFDFTGGNGELRIGSFFYSTTEQYLTAVTEDEVAVWRRALSDTELRNLYRRGHALRVKLQVRVRFDGTLDNEGFIGPDGTPGSYFTEERNTNLGPLVSLDNLVSLQLEGALFQYRVVLETLDPTESPGLLNVTVNAATP